MACLELILCGLYVHFVTEVTTSIKQKCSIYLDYHSVWLRSHIDTQRANSWATVNWCERGRHHVRCLPLSHQFKPAQLRNLRPSTVRGEDGTSIVQDHHAPCCHAAHQGRGDQGVWGEQYEVTRYGTDRGIGQRSTPS
ncbi:hypothetical protein PF010_g30064 [Phytophthora fragariae]|uniref:Secreted protein n=2 Tax=Phytophthora TaxID=4783 RepID=A0A6A3DDU1_9STRA|nr:hypothetical protein PF009_g29877 [Phytophthora fragariae]KAE8963545.1 hypothetical protein PR002_g29256 [Phytophthora rubi]KAE9060813.1 hypothetical protein PF010_g30064 [Phytophthora fragariae]KAE9062021.1 hypothetical protein PF007_g30058 [Phytophthora fragariae]KAE9071348.1 hypothetical protein PF006_g29171 [Phytophthora fragariae]